ncbi:MAG TPA: hypothetical protein VH643_22920 [Gemmataceae bacterium]|jgi:hypothetical protein
MRNGRSAGQIGEMTIRPCQRLGICPVRLAQALGVPLAFAKALFQATK